MRGRGLWAPAHEIECAERCIQRLRQHDRDCGDGRGGIAGVDIEPWQHECCCKYRRIRARGEFLRPTLALSALPANLTQTFASARRLFSVLDAEPAVEERGTEQCAYDGMSLDGVTFGYGDGAPVLRDVTMDIPLSGILGIQGPSGRGKSTLLKLLMHYWDPQQGTVSMSGHALPAIDAHTRRRLQTMMSQETYLFDDTIAGNLRIAKPEASDDELHRALEQASIAALVDDLPEGMETRVGELGDRLSEGERQRLGLARMFLRDASLYLFDEPTSRLDSLNEAYILQSINALVEERDAAVVLVSHRASTMRIADGIHKA